MKRILFALLLSIIAPLSMSAQRATLYTLGSYNGGTNNVAATATNSPTTAIISVEEFDRVGVTVSAKPISTSTGTVVFKFADSVDGTNYETTPSHTVTLTLSGTSTTTQTAQFDTFGTAGLQLVSIGSTNAMAVTNLTVSVRLKAPKRRIETR